MTTIEKKEYLKTFVSITNDNKNNLFNIIDKLNSIELENAISIVKKFDTSNGLQMIYIVEIKNDNNKLCLKLESYFEFTKN